MRPRSQRLKMLLVRSRSYFVDMSIGTAATIHPWVMDTGMYFDFGWSFRVACLCLCLVVMVNGVLCLLDCLVVIAVSSKDLELPCPRRGRVV